MTIRCHVLAKISPSYSYVCGYRVEYNATVDSVSQTAEQLATKCYDWNPDTARVRIELYQPIQSLDGQAETGTHIKDVLLNTVNDEYLEAKCCRVLSEWEPSQGCIIVVVTLSFEYIVFESIGGQKPATYFLRGEVEDCMPSEVVQLVQKLVRQTAERRLGVEKRGVFDVHVYEIIRARSDYENETRRSMSLLTPAGGKPRTPRGGCLFVELVTDTYIDFKYHLFEEDSVQNCTFVATGLARGLPQQTLKVIEEAARDFIAGTLDNEDPRATKARVATYGTKDEARYEAFLDPENRQLTMTDFRGLTKYAPAVGLDRVAQTVVVVFRVS